MTRTDLTLAVEALAAISDPNQTSMRKRDPNCVRYIASNALDELEHRGVEVPYSVRWQVHETVGGDCAGDAVGR